MKKLFHGIILVISGLMMTFGASAAPVVIYDSTPSVLPGNVPSLGYQATSTQEFGNMIGFAGTARDLSTVTIVLSNWALASTYGQLGQSSDYSVPMTFNIYNIGVGNTVGSLIATNTTDVLVPWRPEANATCGTGWTPDDINCYNGLAFLASFDFSGVTLPDSVIYGLAYNTQTHGYQPTGVAGPYNSLNFGLSEISPLVGSDIESGTAFWNTSFAGFYGDGGAGGVGTFRQDTGWAPYSGAVQFVADDALHVPEPGSLALVFTALGGLLIARKKSLGLAK